MHTGLIPLMPGLSREAPEMELGCLGRISHKAAQAALAPRQSAPCHSSSRKQPHTMWGAAWTQEVSSFPPTASKTAEDPPHDELFTGTIRAQQGC